MSETPRSRLPDPTLCLVTDLSVVGGDLGVLVDRVSVAVENGVNVVQIRTPELGSREFGGMVTEIVRGISGRALILVNPSGRPIQFHDGIDGVQLGENAMATVEEVRQVYGENALVGRSVHSLDGARDAVGSGVDYVILGTIFPSRSHPSGQTHGSGIVRTVTEETGLDVIGIGGISVENVGEVIENGARGLAVIRSILGATDPGQATRELMAAILEARSDQV